jgi:hypothetical protein
VRDRQRELYCVPVEEVRSSLADVISGGRPASFDETDADELAATGGWTPADGPTDVGPIAD